MQLDTSARMIVRAFSLKMGGAGDDLDVYKATVFYCELRYIP